LILFRDVLNTTWGSFETFWIPDEYQLSNVWRRIRDFAALLRSGIARKIDYGPGLLGCHTQWVKAHRNVLITGPTGVGKTYLACALANQVCRHGYSVLYCRMPRLFPLLSLAKVDGRYAQLLAQYAKVDVLLLDDWGLAPMTSEARHDLLEILDDRHDRKSTIVTSQLPVEHWHDAMGEATLADAILDRVVHNAHMIKLTGESQRKKRSKID